ncbi:hypothetical protein DSO57_1001969 [Entomophthora muscae]|uniref:Uncharacterized protein n=1 Tax=Entomophthora muscae TaxID=34485 RepID=A0ACC2RNL7_9FUNG|nr:hypothetical protein DSO57_1001969 [Entomophthora muscae]
MHACLVFFEENKHFVSLKYLNELYTHAYRLQLIKQFEEASRVLQHYTVLLFSLILGKYTTEYFEG